MEFAAAGTLQSLLRAGGGAPLPEDTVWRLLIQVRCLQRRHRACGAAGLSTGRRGDGRNKTRAFRVATLDPPAPPLTSDHDPMS